MGGVVIIVIGLPGLQPPHDALVMRASDRFRKDFLELNASKFFFRVFGDVLKYFIGLYNVRYLVKKISMQVHGALIE
jgi:hypothetical protein